MSLERFERERSGEWQRLAGLVSSARGRAERLSSDQILELGALYRSAIADLAIARSRYPTAPPRRRLELLVRDAGMLVYGSGGRRSSIRKLLTDDYWQRIAEKPRFIAIALVLTIIPALGAAIWAHGDPGSALNFIPTDFQGAADPPRLDGDSTGESAAFASYLFTHNIGVSFLAFAAGIAAGIGTGLVVLYNALILGAIAGLAIGAGNGAEFFDFVIPHAPLELSAFLVCEVAGMRIGWAWIAPGNLGRTEALGIEAKKSIDIVLGTMPWLVLAGLSEAFVRGSGLPTIALATIGLSLFSAFWGLVLWRGGLVGARSGLIEADRQSRARALALR